MSDHLYALLAHPHTEALTFTLAAVTLLWWAWRWHTRKART